MTIALVIVAALCFLFYTRSIYRAGRRIGYDAGLRDGLEQQVR
jgi:cbb3-type cytochrome oxidase subunit 3